MKPLLICDCDEVLLHFVRHFGAWLDSDRNVDFDLSHGDLTRAMRPRDGSKMTPEGFFALLDEFFPAEMERQTLVPYARDALNALSQHADIVVLTNLQDHCRDARTEQLKAHGMTLRVETNQGGKGEPVAKLLAEYNPSVAVFVDDLPHHHESVAKHAPGVFRLHMVSEPALADHVAPSPHAHVRIDDWRTAQSWIEERFREDVPAA